MFLKGKHLINRYRPRTGVVRVLIPSLRVIVLPNPEFQLVFEDQNVFKLGIRTLVYERHFMVTDHTRTKKIDGDSIEPRRAI